MPEKYMLGRDAQESARLEEQHKLYETSQGYLIHPTVRSALPKNAQIADIACGTAIWLRAVHADLSTAPSAPDAQPTLHGFDLSPAQFPAAPLLPPAVHLHVADMKRAFPAHLHSSFDLVHIRLVVNACSPSDYRLVLANALALLKPHGRIQWTECDFSGVRVPLRAHDRARTAALRRGFARLDALIHHTWEAAPRGVGDAFAAAGLSDVEVDVVASDRAAEMRETATRMEIGVLEGIERRRREEGVAGAMGEGELERLVAEMEGETRGGGYVGFLIYCFVGRKGD